MEDAIASGRLEKLSPITINKAVTLYTVGVVEINKEGNHYYRFGAGKLSEEDRFRMCIFIAQCPEIIAKLNPAARILFFANLKKSPQFQQALQNDELKNLELTQNVIEQIKNAYSIKTDYNPNHANGHTGWKNIWPSLAGNVGFCNEGIMELWKMIYKFAANGSDQNDETHALAELLLTQKDFRTEFQQCYKKYYCKQNEASIHKYNPEYWEVFPLRLALCLKFEHCARLVVQNPEYRGDPGELTEQDFEIIINQYSLKTTEDPEVIIKQKNLGTIQRMHNLNIEADAVYNSLAMLNESSSPIPSSPRMVHLSVNTSLPCFNEIDLGSDLSKDSITRLQTPTSG